jgi:hypothetical protein
MYVLTAAQDSELTVLSTFQDLHLIQMANSTLVEKFNFMKVGSHTPDTGHTLEAGITVKMA